MLYSYTVYRTVPFYRTTKVTVLVGMLQDAGNMVTSDPVSVE